MWSATQRSHLRPSLDAVFGDCTAQYPVGLSRRLAALYRRLTDRVRSLANHPPPITPSPTPNTPACRRHLIYPYGLLCPRRRRKSHDLSAVSACQSRLRRPAAARRGGGGRTVARRARCRICQQFRTSIAGWTVGRRQNSEGRCDVCVRTSIAGWMVGGGTVGRGIVCVYESTSALAGW